MKDSSNQYVYLGLATPNNIHGIQAFTETIRNAIKTEAYLVLKHENDSRRKTGEGLISGFMVGILVGQITNYVEDNSVVPQKQMQVIFNQSPWDIVGKLDEKIPGLPKDIKSAMHKFIKEEEDSPSFLEGTATTPVKNNHVIYL